MVRKALKASHNSVVDYIIGGWQVNTIAQAHSGLPYFISADGDIANFFGNTGYERADMPQNGKSGSFPHGQRGEWFNAAAFAIPATYTYGDSGRNILRGPAYWNLDASLFRKFPFTESKSLEFRVEAFNLPNIFVILNQPQSDISEREFQRCHWHSKIRPRIIQFQGEV